jgi:hypothetical protein
MEIKLTQKSNGDVEITFISAAKTITLENAYTKQIQKIDPVKTPKVLIPSSKIGGWYDLKISTGNHNWIFAGRAEQVKFLLLIHTGLKENMGLLIVLKPHRSPRPMRFSFVVNEK